MTANEVRQSFLDFFKSKEHEIVASSPVVIPADPTLLFANAGMNQFKDIFLGARESTCKRAADTQKCIRVSGKHNDLEEVGRDTYHHTFFEMLGNWSFGDYYKREAIAWAWELLTEVWKIDKSRLWATVYRDDAEAEALWKEVTDIDPAHIKRFDEKDNFWEMGETGPCGPCSEIHYDATDDKSGGALVNAGSPKVIEIWNLVFIQYNRKSDGSLEELASRHIDTGMGFERITAVLQGKGSNYDTDIFMPLIEQVAQQSGKSYTGDGEDAIAMRVIADHIRTLAVAIADGVMPSNDGRGYVLRRLLRRAVRFGRKLGFVEPFLAELLPTVTQTLGSAFPELERNRETIQRALTAEEKSFLATLDRGIELFEDIASRSDNVFPGEEAFKLYDTFGFPLDLTQLMAEERGLRVDEEAFQRLMERQRARARGARDTGQQNEMMDIVSSLTARNLKSSFSGYEKEREETRVLAVLDDKTILLESTPFYAESGGQLADIGLVECENGVFEVTDTQKPADGIMLHLGRIKKGSIKEGDRVCAVIDADRRSRLRQNHTATHLLNEALRQCVDASIKQAGSMVAPDRLRFDFNYFESLSAEQIKAVERMVTTWIFEAHAVSTKEMPLAEVQKVGSIQAVFDEKYGEVVRVVEVEGVSRELCGGTHVANSSAIGLFRIVAESAVSAGVRRIEAVTGMAAYQLVEEEHAVVQTVSRMLATSPGDIEERIEKLMKQQKNLEKDLKKMQQAAAGQQAGTLLDRVQEIEGVPVLAASLGDMPMDALLSSMDQLREKLPTAIIVLGCRNGEKAAFSISVSNDLVKQGWHAGQMIKDVAKVAGGGGGGPPHKAQAGGKDGSKVGEAIASVPAFMKDWSRRS